MLCIIYIMRRSIQKEVKKMKSHERAAVKRAVDAKMDSYLLTDTSGSRPNKTTIKNLAIGAVRLAELRAKRLYDYNTRQEAVEYAEELVKEYVSWMMG